MGDYAPTVLVAGKDVGGECAEVTGGALNDAGDAFNTSDKAEFALDDHVQIADLKLHQSGVLEDAVPTLTHVFSAD